MHPVSTPSQSASPSPQSSRMPLPLSKPRLSYVILGINILVFLVMTVAGGSTNTEVLIRFGAKANTLIVEGQVWRLFTSMFLHIGVMHLVFNCYALFVLGTEVERLYGSGRFLLIYILAGLWGSLISFAFGPGLSAGASGAIFGLLGAMVAYFRRHRQTFGEWGRQRMLSLMGVVGLNLVLGFTVPGIDNLAHLGGLVSGAILGWILAPNYRVQMNGTTGIPQVVDTTKWLTGWWAVLLAVALLVGGTGGAIAVQRQSAPSAVYQGQKALEAGDLEAAEVHFREAVSRKPDLADAQFYLGVVLSNQGRGDDAVQAYESALQADPELAEAHWNLALTYVDMDQYDNAIDEFESFISLRPDSPDADKARTFIDNLKQ